MGDSSGGFFKAAIAIGVLAAGLGVGYYFGLYLPGRDQARRAGIADCVKAASEQYSQNWEANCQQLKLGKNCKLPTLIAKSNEDSLHRMMDECPRIIP